MAGLCLGWVVSCLRSCSCMNENWPCLKGQKVNSNWGSGRGRIQDGSGQARIRTDRGQIEDAVDVETRSGQSRIGHLERKMAMTAHKPTKQTTREPSSGLSVLVGGWSG